MAENPLPLKFKIGTYDNLYPAAKKDGENNVIGRYWQGSDTLVNGDVCFATIDAELRTGCLSFKKDNTLFNILPKPGTKGAPLVGQGINAAPAYSNQFSFSSMTQYPYLDWFEDSKKVTGKWTSNATSSSLQIGSSNNISGILRLYNSGGQYIQIECQGPDGYTNNAYNYLRLPYGPNAFIARTIWKKETSTNQSGVGDEHTPIYVDQYGQALPCKDLWVNGGFKIYNENKTNGNILYTNKNLVQDINVYFPQFGNTTNEAYLPWTDILTSNNSGDATKPVYLTTSGELVTGEKYSGATSVTLNDIPYNGEDVSFYAPTDLGTENYILISKGEGYNPSWIQYLSLSQGGTGLTSWTANKLLYYDSTSKALTFSNHSINTNSLAINSDIATNVTFSVNGNSVFTGNSTFAGDNTFNGDIVVNGSCTFGSRNAAESSTFYNKIILTNNQYGTLAPDENTNLANPAQGQIYFQII